jgi:hypothetical protein
MEDVPVKMFVTVLAFVAAFVFTTTFAVAQPADLKPQVQMKNQAITKPQMNIKNLPKSAVIPKGQEAGSENTGTEPEEPQGVADIRIQDVQFMPASPAKPSCELKYVATLTNVGVVPSSPSLTLQVVFRVSQNGPDTQSQIINLESIAPGAMYRVGGGVPPRYDGETTVVISIVDNNQVLATASYPLPASENISAANVELSEAVFSTSQMSIVIQNKGGIAVNAFTCAVRGVVNSSGSSERIREITVSCIPAGESETVIVQIPAEPYAGYLVRLAPIHQPQIVAERTYSRP